MRSTSIGEDVIMKYYGWISNCYTAALISADASVDWLPFPRFDSPAVFARLLGAQRNGHYKVWPDEPFESYQRYIVDTNVLKTVFRTPSGQASIIDYLAIGSQELRRLVTTDVPMQIVIRPVFQTGLIAAGMTPAAKGAVFTNPLMEEALQFVVDGSSAVRYDPTEDTWHLDPGRYDLRLVYHPDGSARELDADWEVDAILGLRRNVRFWQRHVSLLYDGPFRQSLKRSLLVLHGLTFRTNGAIVAASTTSLPEVVGGTRQWDYRFAWVRDGCYAAEALLMAGEVVPARRVLEFFLNCVDLTGKPFQAPFFRVDGTLIRGERELDWLQGYRGSRPVREGNAATAQLQLDIEGDLIWSLWRYFEETRDDQFVRAYLGTLESILDWVARRWNQPDACLWEFRGCDAHYTHSKLMCWVALYYGSRLCQAVRRHSSAARYRTAAEGVARAIESKGFNATLGYYTQQFGGHEVDAALLTLPLYGYLDAHAPRFLATLQAIEKELVEAPWVYRYHGDMLGETRHPFVLATYWLIRVYGRLGQRERALSLLRQVLACTTDLGLMGEHVDVATMEPRGNFPQAFSHLGAVMGILELAHNVANAEPIKTFALPETVALEPHLGS